MLGKSKILTQYGYKSIEDVTIDDMMLNASNFFEKQEKPHYNAEMTEIFRLKTYSHPDAINCIPEQYFYVRQKKRLWNSQKKRFEYSFEQPIWKQAKDLTMNDYLGMIINTKHNYIPDFETYDWFMIGYNFSHYSIIQEWLHSAPVRFIKQFITGFVNDEPMTYHLALGIQRLYLKAGILSKIICDSHNKYTVVQYKDASFIQDGYAWYSLQKISSRIEKNVEVFQFEDTFVLQNVLSKNIL